MQKEEIVHVLKSDREIEGWNWWRMAKSSAYSWTSGSLRFLRSNKLQLGGRRRLKLHHLSSQRDWRAWIPRAQWVEDTHRSTQHLIMLPLPKDYFVKGTKEGNKWEMPFHGLRCEDCDTFIAAYVTRLVHIWTESLQPIRTEVLESIAITIYPTMLISIDNPTPRPNRQLSFLSILSSIW